MPPNVKTGVNFGNTSLMSTIYRLNQGFGLGDEFDRQTDSGPDNDAKEAHALHWSLIHYGVLNRFVWIRLKPKHSHNFADRCNSMVKEVIAPKRNASDKGGCQAPWDMERIVNKALAKPSGRLVA